jgi:hypothetical protein
VRLPKREPEMGIQAHPGRAPQARDQGIGHVGEIDLEGYCTNTMRRQHDGAEFVHPSGSAEPHGVERFALRSSLLCCGVSLDRMLIFGRGLPSPSCEITSRTITVIGPTGRWT